MHMYMYMYMVQIPLTICVCSLCGAAVSVLVQDPDDLRLSLLVMRKTLSVMQVLTLWQCGGSFQCLPRSALSSSPSPFLCLYIPAAMMLVCGSTCSFMYMYMYVCRYVADGHRKRYHSALRSLEMAVDRIAILTTSLADANITRTAVSLNHKQVLV